MNDLLKGYKLSVYILSGPGSSPDLTAIKNLRALIKQRILTTST
jgi:hypothetical protein